MSAPRFLFDVHLHKEAARQLRLKGIDVLHVGDIDLQDAPDSQIMAYAIQDGRAMVTCDEGYARFHYTFAEQDITHYGIVYFRMEDQCQSISIIVREIETIAKAAADAADLQDQLWRVSL
ncbi:MAG: DUF5615 family PIN-like protein [Chloroflexi bacterium]|nr:hypothetical protein [Anaerolineae bacterium]MCC6565508.1 DUF5615 family PIN-like protein [Chloroflexota bacterium]MCO6444576.1 DUF5615 family PIN-like protein [Anaerolineae bacterium]MEB2367606.1 DUF5615 family PIN-like protein [Chloroflexota bacterium]NOG51403.1 DUF5615 family PIN-like protein [Chloroflexota bacterium]